MAPTPVHRLPDGCTGSRRYWQNFFHQPSRPIVSSCRDQVSRGAGRPVACSRLQPRSCILEAAASWLQPLGCSLEMAASRLQLGRCNVKDTTSRLQPRCCSLAAAASRLQLRGRARVGPCHQGGKAASLAGGPRRGHDAGPTHKRSALNTRLAEVSIGMWGGEVRPRVGTAQGPPRERLRFPRDRLGTA